MPKEDILYAIKAIVVTQRENGRRDDRRYSRMKYLIDSWGIEKFRSVVEQYYGRKFEPSRELPEWEFKSYLGWHEQVCFVDMDKLYMVPLILSCSFVVCDARYNIMYGLTLLVTLDYRIM